MKDIIAVIEDEKDILELISYHLQRSGFIVKTFDNPEKFLKSINQVSFSLIILDLMLPGMDGIEICKYIKNNYKYASIPIIILTAKADETDKVLGLEMGADDYITKPFSPKELVARVKAVLRRHTKFEQYKKIEVGNLLIIDPQKYEVYVDNKKIDLTTTEFKILEILASKRGFVFSRDKILNLLWGDEKIVVDRTIDVHIKNLREKLGKAGSLIKNIRGIGYKLEE